MPDTIEGRELLLSIKRTLRWVTLATVVLYLVLIGGAIKIWHDTNATNKSLCTLRIDLEVRVASSKTFLHDHPNGVPGISARTVKDSIVNQERTIRALRNLPC